MAIFLNLWIGGCMSEQELTHIEIIAIPPGFPPDWVREYWVGVIIPLANPLKPKAEGLQWNPRTGEIVTGASFEVKTLEAIKALRNKSEEAYQWFVDNEIAEMWPKISFRSAYCKLVVKWYFSISQINPLVLIRGLIIVYNRFIFDCEFFVFNIIILII